MHDRPLFASSLLGIIPILLDQTRQDEIRVIGCHTLFDFVNIQVSSKSLFHAMSIDLAIKGSKFGKILKLVLLSSMCSRRMVLFNSTWKACFQDSVSYPRRLGRMSSHRIYAQQACKPFLLW